METPIPAVETKALAKRYGPVIALAGVDIAIQDNEYFVLLGPSGGGKTTLLRLIGGFARASSGRVLLHGEDMTDVPPERRPTSMVFQSYALFPHMNVSKNVGYGLRLGSRSRAEIASRVDEMLKLVGLSGYGARMPHELSGGQQQRVQLARSLVLERDVLLLDEPLAALDAKLRKDMCFELKRIQEEVGITFVHVTHNQEEAMTVADRVAIISDGELVEVGTTREIYEQPHRRFAAEFIGETNLLEGTVSHAAAGLATVDLGYARIRVPLAEGQQPGTGAPAAVSIRSERISVTADPSQGDGREGVPCSFVKDTYFGLTSACLVRLPNGSEAVARRLTAEPALQLAPGEQAHLTWNTGDARLHLD